MIEIDNVTKRHRRGETEVSALRGVTCGIDSGAFAFIVGPSGSGKSTLLHLIGALDDPTSGCITVDGSRLSELGAKARDEYRRNKVGFVFQNFNLLKNLTALENVLVPFIPQGISAERRQRAVELLRHVGLGERMSHRPSQLSGGEQQRVAIARALLKQPSLVLADEPTGELDSQNGADVYRYLRQLHTQHGTTIVVVTHETSFIQEGDQVLRLYDGRLEGPSAPPPRSDPE